ncbi:MAG TPA: DUF1223 domain-containing protein [Terriglobales bacterium]|nr:DUF1223 domain-containing protein [Terriglobales bacterium]
MIRLAIVAMFSIAALLLAATAAPVPSPTSSPVPVVVELFTSEGCSSCPPADALLQKFDKQPYASAELIVLSEHVDYWNHIGWTDPYSAHIYSERQSAYGDRLHLDSVYTPQMIVDGTTEFVGSSSHEAEEAFKRATSSAKIPVHINNVRLEGNVLKGRIETGTLPAQSAKADVIVVVALNHAESQVAAGENSGRRLTHVAVVRALVKEGSIAPGQSFSQDVAVKLEKAVDPAQLRVIAFVQEPGPGRILGAAQEKQSK